MRAQGFEHCAIYALDGTYGQSVCSGRNVRAICMLRTERTGNLIRLVSRLRSVLHTETLNPKPPVVSRLRSMPALPAPVLTDRHHLSLTRPLRPDSNPRRIDLWGSEGGREGEIEGGKEGGRGRRQALRRRRQQASTGSKQASSIGSKQASSITA